MLSGIRSLYTKLKPQLPTVCFLCGSTWDSLTLKRIDSALDLTIFSTYLFLSSIIVILISRKVNFRFAKYLPSAAQFFFGGMFSACTVYYFKSTSSLLTFLFLLCLAATLVCNEFLEKKYSNAQVTFTFWSVCAAMILNFLLPVLTGLMSPWIFLAAIATAFLLCFAISRIALSKVSLKPVALIYSALILFYFLNVIPPVPLSQKKMAIFRSVSHSGNEYVCTMEKPRWFEPFKSGESVFKYSPQDTVFCFSSVFAPTRLKKEIYHHWYYKDPESGKWSEATRIGYRLTGGRDQGYRGYTYKKNIGPGSWKVMLKTKEGKTVGIRSFKVVSHDLSDTLSLLTVRY
ncbi:MAG: DUF2914 domain-containing protein [Fibrobacter sp.]|nr:DUF2914 domain-containing protein [Fibrobacter sp.]